MVHRVTEGLASSGDNQDFWYLLYTCHHRVCSVSLLKYYPETWKESRQGLLPQSVACKGGLATLSHTKYKGVCASQKQSTLGTWIVYSIVFSIK